MASHVDGEQQGMLLLFGSSNQIINILAYVNFFDFLNICICEYVVAPGSIFLVQR